MSVLFLTSTQMQAGRIDEAEKVLLDFIDVLEPDARLYISLGRIKQARRSYDEAATYFNDRKVSIYSGSNEIQKNIMTKFVLGL